MNRVLTILRERSTGAPATDRHLLDRFLTAGDEAAFAELVRRYGPVVWGTCRRALPNAQDAEDAFQATFLVLLRRAARLEGDAPLGPWLHKVAVMTARNVSRANRRRAVVTGPMEHEVPAPGTEPTADRLDLDAALLHLPERYRVPVVLCHLQGMTRREAAERLGCPEGTLSARLNRALQRLRARLGNGFPAVLIVPALTLPAGLASATTRSATIYSTSTLSAIGMSRAVVELTDGVLRMFWMKKVLTAAAAVLVLGAGVLALGAAVRSENVARATEPAIATAVPGDADDQEIEKRLEKRLADLQKQKELLDTTLEDLKAEKQKLEAAKKDRAAADAAAALGKDIAVVVGEAGRSSAFTVREVVNGRIAEVSCSNLDILTTYLTRAFNDPKGPKKLRVSAYKDQSVNQLRDVFAACVTAGYTKAAFGYTERPAIVYRTQVVREYKGLTTNFTVKLPEGLPQPGEIDLRKFAEPKKQP